MKTQRLGDSVDEGEIGHASGYDFTQIESNKVPISDNGLVAYAGDIDEDQEDEGEEEEKGGCQRPSFATAGCELDLLFAKFGDRRGRCILRRAVAREEWHGDGRVQQVWRTGVARVV